MKIYFVRHGQTDWNVLEKVQGKADIELNDVGKNQAKELREKTKNIDFDLIICSSLIRARQTAEIINENRNLEIIIDERISEREFGEFEGKKTSEFSFEDFWNYEKNEKYIKAENIRDFFNKIYMFLDEIKEKYKDKNVLIVSHGGVSIPVKCYFNGIPDIGPLNSLCVGNCEIAEF